MTNKNSKNVVPHSQFYVSPCVGGKVILHSSAIPHRVDAAEGVRPVMAVLLLDSLLEVSYRIRSQRSGVRGRTVTLND